jgi:ubiquinone/menaquinone biosynthesis C-methylase UbiE
LNRKTLENCYRCPSSGSQLTLENGKSRGDEIISGHLVSINDESYPIIDGIPDFTFPQKLTQIDQETRLLYENIASEYHKFSNIPFQSFNSSEVDVRNGMVDRLSLQNDSKVLEVGCGCGDGSIIIAERLDANGELFLQELSPAFLGKAVEKLKNVVVPTEFSVANACYLSFPDNYFDAAYHFGGSNTFSEIERFLFEISRVVKPGGKVVFGDEGMAPWLRETEFGKIMMNSNPLMRFKPPIKYLPVTAQNVKVEWIMMGGFFIIEFTVGTKEPVGNYHIPIPSERGGTHWTRYYGQLEGISDEGKKLAYEAQKRSGKSMSDWLDEVVKEVALKELTGKE